MQQKQSNIKKKGTNKNKKLWAMSINTHKLSQKHHKALQKLGPGGVSLSNN